jgi:hypothetical protein
MITRKWIFKTAAVLIICCHLVACSQGPSKTDTTKDSIPKKVVPVKKYYYNEVAKFLAGIKPDTVAPFNTLIRKAQWVSYSRSFDSTWNKFKDSSLVRVQKWSGSELKDINKVTKTLFYPFSGPDFLYANTFFPTAEKYILFGLERTGSITDMKNLNDKNINSFFASINKALENILNRSFFITSYMQSQLNNQDIDGVVPVIMIFMARTGNTVKNIKNANITTDGKVTVADTFLSNKGKNHYGQGVEITFSPARADSIIKKLYYFSADISDAGLTSNPGCKTYLQNIDSNVTTFVKSASYLMHGSEFVVVRNTVLSKSKFLLQDDSGVAYRFLDQKKWKFQCYGTYDKPIPVFSYCYQGDLNAAYIAGSKPFDFKYGYGKGRNMLLARKIL